MRAALVRLFGGEASWTNSSALSLRERSHRGIGSSVSGRPVPLSRKYHGTLFATVANFPEDAVTIEGETRDYRNWIVRRETWLPPFPIEKRYDRYRESTERSDV